MKIQKAEKEEAATLLLVALWCRLLLREAHHGITPCEATTRMRIRKTQKFVIFLFQSRLGPVLWIACLLAIAKQRNWSRNPLAASAIPWGRLGTKTWGSRNCVFSFTFTFSWNTQHNRRMATRDRDQLRCFHHKVGLWNLQSSYVLLCWFVFNSVSQEYVCPFRQGQGRRDFKWGTCKG